MFLFSWKGVGGIFLLQIVHSSFAVDCGIEVVSMVDPAVCNLGLRLLRRFGSNPVAKVALSRKGSIHMVSKDGRRDLLEIFQ